MSRKKDNGKTGMIELVSINNEALKHEDSSRGRMSSGTINNEALKHEDSNRGRMSSGTINKETLKHEDSNRGRMSSGTINKETLKHEDSNRGRMSSGTINNEALKHEDSSRGRMSSGTINKETLYEYIDMLEGDFPIRISTTQKTNTGTVFASHWHEHIEFLYFLRGKAIINCNSQSIEASAGDLIVINSNTLHSGENISDNLLYHIIIVDVTKLHSIIVDSCETRYLIPLEKNLILFENRISADRNITSCIKNIIKEYKSKNTGYELAIRSNIYMLLVLLLRSYIKTIITENEYRMHLKNLERFKIIFRFIQENYTENLNIHNLSEMLNISTYHFCRLFKETTGKTLSQYVNSVRIGKAEELLLDTNNTITEIAASTGFDDINYFSRVFRQFCKTSPTRFRKLLHNRSSLIT